MLKLKNDFLTGSFPPVVTPFTEGTVDYQAYARLVKFHVDNGSHGIVVNGTSSEPSTLKVTERNRLVDVALETVNGKITVVAATGSQSFAETSESTRHATQAGADAILVVTPYYIRPSQAGMVDYFAAISELTDRPLMMYRIPVRTAFTATIETLEQIVHRAPDLVGMKHASMDFSLVTHALQNFGFDFRVFVGLKE